MGLSMGTGLNTGTELAAMRGPLLLAYLRDVRVRWTGFAPGQMDCANFAHGWFLTLGGADVRARLSFEYSSLGEGKRLLAQRGFACLGDLAASVMPEIAVADAVLGDIALVEVDGDLALGILSGSQVHVLTLNGLGAISASYARRGFRP